MCYLRPRGCSKAGIDTKFSKLADWDDDDPAAIPTIHPKFEKTVILKHMFTLNELAVRETLRQSSKFTSY